MAKLQPGGGRKLRLGRERGTGPLRSGRSARASAQSNAFSALGHEPRCDYYEVLGVSEDASFEEIKSAFRQKAFVCHPDKSTDEDSHNLCVLLNEAYETLSQAEKRAAYDRWRAEQSIDGLQDDGFTGEPFSKWCGPGHKMCRAEDPASIADKAIFVDEATCIGCKNCMWCAPATFRMEPECASTYIYCESADIYQIVVPPKLVRCSVRDCCRYGRARVYAQWVNKEEEIYEAIQSCPVECIHEVNKDELPVLEYAMRYKTPRPNVGVMMGGSGEPPDVFAIAKEYMKQRERKQKERERRWMQQREQAYERENKRATSNQRVELLAGVWRHMLESTGLARVLDAIKDAPFFAQSRNARNKKDDDGDDDGGNGMIPFERALVHASWTDDGP